MLDKCTVTGTILKPDGSPCHPGTVVFRMSNRDRDGGITIMPAPVEVAIGSDGAISVDLWPNSDGYAGTVYTAQVLLGEGLSTARHAPIKLVVPDAETANLAAISELVPPAKVDDAQVAVNEARGYAEAAHGDAVTVSEAKAAIDGMIGNVDTVAGHIASVDALAAKADVLDPLAAIVAQITTVAGISDDVSAVAAIHEAVSTLAENIGDVTALAAALANVNTVAGIVDAINAVAGISADVSAVAAKKDDVSTVAGIAGNVTTVAGEATEIATVVANLAAILAAPAQATAAADSATLAQKWAEGTLPGGAGTKSAKEYATDAAGSAATAAAATQIVYGVDIYHDLGVPTGGYFAERRAPNHSTQDALYAEIISGEVGGEVDLDMQVDGVTVYGPVTAVAGTPVDLSGLSIDIPVGKTVGFTVIAVRGTVTEFFAQAYGAVA